MVNNGSGNVALFRRDGDELKFDKVIQTTSAPVSVDFGNDHLYVAGATTVDSFTLHEGVVEWLDGTTSLALAGGGIPPAGSTGQVGVLGDTQLLVTLKTDPDPGTIDVISLHRGRVTGSAPTAVAAPDGTLAPFGFATYPDGTALITLAHSNQDGLFRDGSFASVVAAGQTASCWMTRAGKYVFVANTGSRSISRVVGHGKPRLRRQPDRGPGPDRITGRHRRGCGRAGRHRPWRRPITSVRVLVQPVRRAHAGRRDHHDRRP